MCVRLLTVALFFLVGNWKQPESLAVADGFVVFVQRLTWLIAHAQAG